MDLLLWIALAVQDVVELREVLHFALEDHLVLAQRVRRALLHEHPVEVDPITPPNLLLDFLEIIDVHKARVWTLFVDFVELSLVNEVEVRSKGPVLEIGCVDFVD